MGHDDAHPNPSPRRSKGSKQKCWRVLLRVLLMALTCALGVFVVAVLIVKIEPLLRPHVPSFDEEHPTVGEAAPDFILKDVDDTEYHLSEHLGRRPLVLEFGSST